MSFPYEKPNLVHTVRKAYKAKALETHPDKLDSVKIEEGENIHGKFIEVLKKFRSLWHMLIFVCHA